MHRNRFSLGLLGILCLSLMAAKESNSTVAGLWIYKGDNVRIDMDLKADGKCVFDAVSGDKKSTVSGTYHVEPGHLIVTSKKKTLKYAMKLDGDRMTLSGGDFGEGNTLTFSKREMAAANDPAPVPMAGKKKDNDKPADKGGDADAGKELAGLPGGKWDTKFLDDHFTTVKAPKYDSVKATVTLLVERKDDGYLALYANFYDEDDVKLGSTFIQSDPVISGVKAGERLRIIVPLLSEDKMKQCVKVVITKG